MASSNILCSAQPPDDLLRDAQNTNKFFKQVGGIYRLEDEVYKDVIRAYCALTAEEYEAVSHVIILIFEAEMGGTTQDYYDSNLLYLFIYHNYFYYFPSHCCIFLRRNAKNL